jgi:hypothetical protein
MKAQFVIDLLKTNANRFTPVQLETATGSPRRARRALFLARKAGVTLEAIRDSGRAVTAYVLSGSVPAIAAPAPARKAAKAASPKIAAKAKAAKTISKEVDAIVAKNKAPSKKAAATAEVRAKNLETIKAVHAKTKQKVAKHPITGRDLTDDQADVLEEFRALELAYETEEQERNAARAAVRENLPKEVYAE